MLYPSELEKKYEVLVLMLILGVSNIYANEYAEEACISNEGSSEPCNECCCGTPWVSADLLYLSVCEGGFDCDLGTTSITKTLTDGKNVTDVREKSEEIAFGWTPGFRVGVGYDFASSCFEAALYWTRFSDTGSGHEANNYAKLDLRFNEVDALLGYKLTYCDRFTLMPFLGVRYAKIDQALSSHLESTILIRATNARSVVVSTKHDTQHFWGIGPLFGLEGNLYFGCGFSIYGILAGNFLYGDFENDFNKSDIFTQAVNTSVSSSENCAVLTGFDAGLGLRYAFCFATLQLGWEHHTYFDYNTIGCGGDLNLYGLNASVIFHF